MKTLSDLRKYLSEKTGISETYKYYYDIPPKGTFFVTLNNVEYQLRRKSIKGGLIFETSNPFDDTVFDINTTFDEIYHYIPRPIYEFNVEVQVKPKSYKYDEGNGWYSMQDIYIIDNIEFIGI